MRKMDAFRRSFVSDGREAAPWVPSTAWAEAEGGRNDLAGNRGTRGAASLVKTLEHNSPALPLAHAAQRRRRSRRNAPFQSRELLGQDRTIERAQILRQKALIRTCQDGGELLQAEKLGVQRINKGVHRLLEIAE